MEAEEKQIAVIGFGRPGRDIFRPHAFVGEIPTGVRVSDFMGYWKEKAGR